MSITPHRGSYRSSDECLAFTRREDALPCDAPQRSCQGSAQSLPVKCNKILRAYDEREGRRHGQRMLVTNFKTGPYA